MTDSLPKERLDELDALADAATPGPWEVHETNESSTLRFMRPLPEQAVLGGGRQYISMNAENAAFIAALDPDTVRALIAMARRAHEAEAKLMKLRSTLHPLAADWATVTDHLDLAPDATAGEVNTTIDAVAEKYHGAGYEAGAADAEAKLEEVQRATSVERDRWAESLTGRDETIAELAAKLEQVRALAAANNRLRDSENACMVYAPSILAIIDQTKEGE